MTINITASRQITGLSTDTKPTSGITTGAKFLETDTGAQYYWNGTAWTGTGAPGAFAYLIEKKGSTYYCISMSSNAAVSSGTAQTVIQYAIDTLATGFDGDANRPKGSVYIRNNAFYTGLDLTLKSGIWLVGEGVGTILTGKITVQDASDSTGLYKIYCYNAAADHVLYLNGARSFTAENCKFQLDNTTLTKFPVLIDGGTNFGATNSFIKCQIVSKGHGLKQCASATSKYTNTTSLIDCYVVYNAGSTATGGQIGLNFDGDAVEKNTYVRNCYLEQWDTAVSLDSGWCNLEGLWVDVVNTAGVDVTQAAINVGSQYIDVSTATTTTQPLIILGGRKYYATSSNYSMVYDNRRIFPYTAWIEKYLIPAHNPVQHYALMWGSGSVTASAEGMLTQATLSGTAANSGNYTDGRWVRHTSAAGGTDNAGFRYTGSAFMHRGWNPSYFAKMRIFDKANTRGWFGLFSPTTEPTGDDWLNAGSGYGLGWKAGDANWYAIHNDGTGATVYDDTSIALASNTIYTLEIRMEDTTPRIGYSINGSTMAFTTTELPAQTTALVPHFQVEETAAAAKNLDRFHVFIRGDK